MISLAFGTIFLVSTLAYCCPPGSIVGLRPDECYLSRPGASWNDAEEDCVVAGGHLASVHDAFTNSFLRKLPKYGASETSGFWIGGSFGGTTEDRWSWTDGSPFDFASWANGNPLRDGPYCLMISNADELWYCVDCDGVYAHVCKITATTTQHATKPPAFVPTCPAQRPTCQSGWAWFDATGFCYKSFHTAYVDWTTAKQKCAANGAHLVSIHNYQEQLFVQELSAAGVAMNWSAGHWDGGMWIGLTDSNELGTFEWTDGTPLDYNNWAPGRPAVSTTTTCGDFYPDWFAGWDSDPWYNRWDNGMACSTLLRGFICKKRSIV